MADRTFIRIGEPVNVKLTAVWPGKTGFTRGFIIPDSIPHFDIWDKQNPVNTKDGIEQMLTVTSYDSGLYAIPSFKLSTTGNVNSPATYGSQSILIKIMPVNVDSLKDYHDIKDIIEVPPVAQWPYILAISAITLIAGVALYFLLKKLGIGKKPTRRSFENGMLPYEAALSALNKLEIDCQRPDANFPQDTMGKLFFTQLTNIYRNYLSDAHNFRSHQQTGGELILQAKPLLNHELFFQFANTIRLSDAAKFAKYVPPKDEWITGIQNIKEAITVMEKKNVAT